MFDVISAGRNTKWLAFPTLSSHSTYSHTLNQEVDFQVVPRQNVFVGFNKSYGFELLQTGIVAGQKIVKPIKKQPIAELSCGAVSKTTGNELALGMKNGDVRVFDIRSNDFTAVKLRADRSTSNVVALDFSCCDGYLAAVYENAKINLFGLRTGVKTDTFQLDGFSTLVKFHPVKKFVLAVASFEGAVTLLDIQTKKKIFAEKSAHKAPTRDMSMFPTAPDIFVSCGFDCQVNVYDTRKRSAVQRYAQPSPLSTICVSPCGTQCIVGNLKGELTAFDFRNMSAPLETKRVHDGAVIRVAFIPSNFGEVNLSTDDINNANIERNAPRGGDEALSFLKFVDQCRNNKSDIDGLFAADDTAKNDSWNDLLCSRQQANGCSLLDSPAMGLGNVTGQRLKRATLDGMSGSPIMAPSPNSDMISTPKSIGRNNSGRAESTPIIFEESPTELHELEKHSERQIAAGQTLRRRSSFTDEFNPSNMSTPLLRTQAPIQLKHKLYDVIEEESCAISMASRAGESQIECKENQQNNNQFSNAPPVAAQQMTGEDIAGKMNLSTVKLLSNDINCMSETYFAAMMQDVVGASNDVVSAKLQKASHKFDAAIDKITGNFQRELIHYKEMAIGRDFGRYMKFRMMLKDIEHLFQQILSGSPDQMESEFSRLQMQWNRLKDRRDKDLNNNF